MITKKLTLCLDEDLVDALRERAHSLNQTIEEIVIDTLRQELTPRVGEAPGAPYRVEPFRSELAPGVDPKNPKEILNDLDDERYLRITYGEDRAIWPDWLRERRGING